MNAPLASPLPFGIDASTGRPLDVRVPAHLSSLMLQQENQQQATARSLDHAKIFGVPYDLDTDSLAEVGWGVIVAANVDASAYLDALARLLKRRQAEAGALYRVFAGADGYRSGESASTWLNRNGASLNLINPADGMPYYLVIVGPPTEIPFEFQYSLDIVAAVGRLDFPTTDALRAYADSVVAFEEDGTKMTRRQIDLFATCHDFDRATQLFTEQVAQPFLAETQQQKSLGAKYDYTVKPYLHEQSTKAALAAILSDRERPASILFTGSHGMAFPHTDARQGLNQGALVCNDWPGYGNISSEHWFAAQDVPAQANVHGLMHFFFACYSLGTPEFDNFPMQTPAPRIAPAAMTARLPQTLMSLPQGGVLASLGHIDRAWASSFQSPVGRPQAQGFRDVLARLMAGQRIGHATDQFNGQWGVVSTQLIELLNDKAYGKTVSDAALLSLRVARDDCRNYVVLGDPAVKLRPEPPSQPPQARPPAPGTA
ncbi:C25 family cysteine peptidase [Massilia sp. DWR3-1-1]|uniref:C25 family cysteine peptidase n=1 Tax=Massilia sp. DWR3-1-1 TaxID=2804559 RepID=UPI003CEA1DCC